MSAPEMPRNLLVSDHPEDTLAACENVLAFMMDAMRHDLEDASRDGATWVTMLVISALCFERERAIESRKPKAA